MIPACRSALLPVFLGTLLLSLSAAPGCCHRARNGSAGVPVTKEVPHSRETLAEIIEREKRDPLPAPGDRAIPSHGIHRAGDDGCGRPE